MTTRETAAEQLRKLIELAKAEQDGELEGWLQTALDRINGKRPQLRGGTIATGSEY